MPLLVDSTVQCTENTLKRIEVNQDQHNVLESNMIPLLVDSAVQCTENTFQSPLFSIEINTEHQNVFDSNFMPLLVDLAVQCTDIENTLQSNEVKNRSAKHF